MVLKQSKYKFYSSTSWSLKSIVECGETSVHMVLYRMISIEFHLISWHHGFNDVFLFRHIPVEEQTCNIT